MKQELPEVLVGTLYNLNRHEMCMISWILRNTLQSSMKGEKTVSLLSKTVELAISAGLFLGGKGGKYSEYYDNGEDIIDMIEEEPEGNCSMLE